MENFSKEDLQNINIIFDLFYKDVELSKEISRKIKKEIRKTYNKVKEMQICNNI